MNQAESPTALPDDLRALRVAQVAPMLSCSRATVYNLINSGRLRSIRLCGEIRVPVTALKAYLAGDPPSNVTPLGDTRQRRAG